MDKNFTVKNQAYSYLANQPTGLERPDLRTDVRQAFASHYNFDASLNTLTINKEEVSPQKTFGPSRPS